MSVTEIKVPAAQAHKDVMDLASKILGSVERTEAVAIGIVFVGKDGDVTSAFKADKEIFSLIGGVYSLLARIREDGVEVIE
jgi:hypothetical protein